MGVSGVQGLILGNIVESVLTKILIQLYEVKNLPDNRKNHLYFCLEIIGTCIALALISVLYEGLKIMREVLKD